MVDRNLQFKICLEGIGFGKYTKNYLDRFPMRLKLVKKQETFICISEELGKNIGLYEEESKSKKFWGNVE